MYSTQKNSISARSKLTVTSFSGKDSHRGQSLNFTTITDDELPSAAQLPHSANIQEDLSTHYLNCHKYTVASGADVKCTFCFVH